MDCEPKKTKLEKLAEQPKSVTGDQGVDKSLFERTNRIGPLRSQQKSQKLPDYLQGRFQPPGEELMAKPIKASYDAGGYDQDNANHWSFLTGRQPMRPVRANS